ncbi:TIGR03084 family metal-binding protein [Cryobacterium tagatosivorans]|uniref:TIGR03084 family protein n=1 Tax=Cryobacterium tagatosivorans TaxID=1259199 RepID=A0A4R8UC80_9MICO|nr:TIGR03084 family metal-binding protein [Cryobacterium tagatosivorans]TFB46761.1 TIGR03084 family protein [Cryobacterium tagatosivorans]
MAMDDRSFASLLRDLATESAELANALRRLSAAEWLLATPAAGWDIHDQVVHLAFFGDLALLGFTDPEGFGAAADELRAAGPDWVDVTNAQRTALAPDDTLRWFTDSHAALGRVLAEAGPGARTAWFGPSMSAASAATARLMETWAHGQDVYDALGLEHQATDRVRHVCHLGVITRGFAYELRGRGAPPEDVRVELLAPGGGRWAWGPADAADRITGSANDFALVVTQRRHRADTALRATPGAAEDWLGVAQAFAGAPGGGRLPGQFSGRQAGQPTGQLTGQLTEDEGSQ